MAKKWSRLAFNSNLLPGTYGNLDIKSTRNAGIWYPFHHYTFNYAWLFYIFKNQTIKISIWLSDPPTPLIDMTAMIGFSEMDLDPRKRGRNHRKSHLKVIDHKNRAFYNSSQEISSSWTSLHLCNPHTRLI